MATLLDLRPGESTAAASPTNAIMAAAQRAQAERDRKAALDEEQNTRANEALKLSQQQNQREAASSTLANQKSQNELNTQTIGADIEAHQQTPEYKGIDFDHLPPETRQHFSIDTYGPAAATARGQWDAALNRSRANGPVEPNETRDINDKGEVSRRFAPTPVSTTGQVTERDLAEKGLNPSAIPREQWATALAAKMEPVKAKLDVQQKAALGAAAQSVPVLTNALAQYDTLNKGVGWNDHAGVIAGGFDTLKNKLGVGNREFAKANAELRGNLFNIARSLQGAGVLTEMDIKRMEEIAPSLRMNRDQFAGQVDAVKGLMRERLEAWRDLNNSALDDSQRALADRLIEQTKQPTGAQPSLPPAAKPTGQSVAPAPAAPAQKPATVRQNGVVYTLGEDGAYH